MNGNGALVQAVKSFQDDAVSGYVTFAKADGNSLTQEQSDAANKQADGLASFMSLFQSLGAADQSMLKGAGGTYYPPNGAKLDCEQPSTVIGFLALMQSAQAARDGTATLVTSSGKTMAGTL